MMKPYGGEGLLARSLRAPRVRADYSFRTALMTRECPGWLLAPTVAESHGAAVGRSGQLADQLANQLAGQLANQPANQFAGQLANQTPRSPPEKKRTNFVSRISRCTQRTRCPLLIWMPRKRRRSSALKDRSLAMRQELAGRRPASQELAGRGPISWRSPVVGIRGNGNSA